MTQILTDIYSVTELYDLLETGSRTNLENAAHLLENLVICDSVLVDIKGRGDSSLEKLCENFGDAFTPIHDIQVKTPHNSSNGRPEAPTPHVRTRHYIELASKHDVYLSLHPERSSYLRSSFHGITKNSAARIAIERFDSKLWRGDPIYNTHVDVSLPPLADHVIEFSRKRKVDLVTAVCELRMSRNAVEFRKWCSELDIEIRNCAGRAAFHSIQQIRNQIDAACKVWTADLDVGVKYTPRTLSLGKVWGIGFILEALGFDEIQFRDPVLAPDRQHLLFINDIYRSLE